jgi:hypothetical protein
MSGAISPLPHYVFMAWCLVEHRDNFNFYLSPQLDAVCAKQKGVILGPLPLSCSYVWPSLVFLTPPPTAIIFELIEGFS